MTSIEGVDKMWSALKSANPFWLLVAIISLLASWFAEIYITHALIIKTAKKNQTLKSTINLGIIGKIFDHLTPFSSGGEPAQVYKLSQEGVPIGRGTSLTMIRTVIYQFVSVIISSILILIGFNYFYEKINNFSFLIIIGLVANISVGLLMFMATVLPDLSRKVVVVLINFLCRIRVIKDRKKRLARVDQLIKDFSEGPKKLGKDKSTIAKLVGLTVLQLLFYYIVPFFVFLGLGSGNLSQLLPSVTAAVCVGLISSYVPLPGGTVGAEGAFFLFFSIIYPDTAVGMAVLIWRFITFYLQIIIGSFVVVGDNSKKVITNS